MPQHGKASGVDVGGSIGVWAFEQQRHMQVSTSTPSQFVLSSASSAEHSQSS